MAKAEIHAKLVDENGKPRIKVEANGYALDLLDMICLLYTSDAADE